MDEQTTKFLYFAKAPNKSPKSDYKPQVKWAVSLVITGDHFTLNSGVYVGLKG